VLCGQCVRRSPPNHGILDLAARVFARRSPKLDPVEGGGVFSNGHAASSTPFSAMVGVDCVGERLGNTSNSSRRCQIGCPPRKFARHYIQPLPHTHNCHHPRKRMIQYSRASCARIEKPRRTEYPLEPVLGLAEGETRGGYDDG
jgi:hypothetical protein